MSLVIEKIKSRICELKPFLKNKNRARVIELQIAELEWVLKLLKGKL